MSEQKPNLIQRVARYLLNENTSQAVQKETIKVIHVQDDGTYGSKSFSGYTQEEYLNTLQGFRRADEFDKMRRSDSTIIMLLNSIKNLIRCAVWEIEPADESDEAKKDAELIKHILFNDMVVSWQDFINEALTMIEFGHSVFEYTHKIVQNDPTFGSYVGLKNLAWRSPRTIDKWNLNDDGTLKSIHQMSYGDIGKLVEIPAEFLVVMTINKEGAGYEGISMLRPCYGGFKRKAVYMKLNAIGIEKFAIPTPVVEVPEVDLNSPQYQNMIQILQDFTGHESQYITFPVGWKVTLVNNTYDPEKVEKTVDAEDKRMANAFLANFLNLGSSGSGSYALSNDLSDFFMSGLDYIARIIEQEINRSIIPMLIQANKGPRSSYPKLIHSGITDKAGKELTESIKNLIDSQTIIPDDNFETFIRQKFGWPKASTEGQRKPPEKNAGFGGGAPLLSENSFYRAIKLAEQKKIK